MIRFGLIFSIFGLLLLCGFHRLIAQEVNLDPENGNPSKIAPSLPTYDFLRDTLFLLDSVYVEIRLDKQAIFQHFRGGRVKRFKCSTGNPRLPDAIATREGIFSIQWKSQRYMSRQFEVWLNYWMPFDGGIGFHGLDGRSYYKYLGRRPSSHGCVRISNETGRELFATLPRGTVVYVHSGSPARILHFADPEENTLRVIGATDGELLGQRLEAVARCNADHPSLRQHLALPKGEKAIGTIAVGRANRTMRVQYNARPLRVPLLDAAYSPRKPAPPQQLSPLPPPVSEPTS